MNPIDSIAILKMAPNEHLTVIAVLKGRNKVARIDLFKKHDSPEKIREALRAAGLHFCNLVKTSGKPDHVCGMAVALTQDLAFEFKTANERGDRATMKRLTGEFIIPPPEAKESDPYYLKNIRSLAKEFPLLILEMILKPQTVV
jgi:hypothetical protein